MSIKYVELSNGSKYPIGYSTIEPVVSGKAVEYPIDMSIVASPDGSLSIDVAGNITTVPAYLLTTATTFTADEIAAMHLSVTNGGVTGEFDYPYVTDINGLVAWFLASQSITLDSPFTTFTESCGMMGIGGAGLSLLSVPSPIARTEQQTIMSGGATVTLTGNLPTAGTYWLVDVDPTVLQSPSGTLIVGDFDFDRRFTGTKSIVLTNKMLIDEIDSGTVDLTSYPKLQSDLQVARQMGYPVTIYVHKSSNVVTLTSVMLQPSARKWTFYDGSTLTANSGFTTLTYTAAS